MKSVKDLFSRKPKETKLSSPAGTGGEGGQRDVVMEMYEKYKDKEDNQIGPEGIFELCSDMNLEPTDVKLLILAWKLNAETQGYFTRTEWQRGMEGMRVDSPQSLLAKLDSVHRQLRGASSSQAFKEFYRFSFRFSRSPGQKALEIDTVKALLPTVLPPPHPHVEKLLEFLNESPTIRGFNEDQWASFLLFSHDIKPDFSNFDPDGAWPSVLDDYASYCKEKEGGSAA
mmetsp:Transcript_1226/g.2893  ORF Transcript_1226/g.2893 Transcript_1226/m.2893 type:complete len:228 (+) Transcript_1226:54-737(+)